MHKIKFLFEIIIKYIYTSTLIKKKFLILLYYNSYNTLYATHNINNKSNLHFI